MYEIMFDWGSEGYGFYNELDDSVPRAQTRKKFDSIEDAVKFAVGRGYTAQFIIVKVVWEPT